MQKIAIFGASSQVGSSIAFYLRHFTDILPICFIRSSYSAVFFETHDIIFYSIKGVNDPELKILLNDIEFILDFNYPAGQLVDIPNMIRKSITEIFSVLAPGSTYIHMSSIMAHGMPDGQYALSSFLFARNSYGYIKRKAEKFALRLGQKNGIAVYNFRLSQVHGFLQSVNSVFRAISTQSEVLSNGNKDSLSNTIFIHALGNAILQVVGKKWVPGTYALVSNPQWTLFELYEFYSTRYGIQTKITYLDKIDKSRNKLKDNLFSSIIQRLKPYRQIIETYLLLKIPSYTLALKGKYRINQVHQSLLKKPNSVYQQWHILGQSVFPVPLDLNSSTEQALKMEEEMEALYYANIINFMR